MAYRWSLLISAVLAAILSILASTELGITATGTGDFNPCSQSDGSGLVHEAPPNLHPRFDSWAIEQGDIGGFPPNRTCRLFGLRVHSPPDGRTYSTRSYVLQRAYPGNGWYLLALLFVISPLLLAWLWRTVKSFLRRPSLTRPDRPNQTS
jgi:hypothetical protein